METRALAGASIPTMPPTLDMDPAAFADAVELARQNPIKSNVSKKDAHVQKLGDAAEEQTEPTMNFLAEGFTVKELASSVEMKETQALDPGMLAHFIHIINPPDGAVWYKGEAHDIAWSWYLPEKTDIKLTATSAAQPNSPIVIASKKAPNAQGTWTIPAGLDIQGTDPGTPETTYTFRVETLDGSIADSRTISICKPSIEQKVLFGTLVKNKQYKIEWTSKGHADKQVRVNVSTQYGDRSYTVDNTGEMLWAPSYAGVNTMQLEVVTPGQEVRSKKAVFIVMDIGGGWGG